MPFLEVKRTLAGEQRTYQCEALHVSPRVAIVRFVFTRPLSAGGLTMAAGDYTIGFFWSGRTYNLYHMLTAAGEPIADRFDVLDHVRIHQSNVRYDDLLLDVWRFPDGRIAVEDEDEVEAALAAGQLSQRRQATIARTRALLLRRAGTIAAQAVHNFEQLRSH